MPPGRGWQLLCPVSTSGLPVIWDLAVQVGRAAPQIVQVRDRQTRQALERLLPEDLKLALKNAARGRPVQALMRAVYFG